MPTFSGIVVPTGAEATGRRTLLEVIDELARPVDASDPTIRALAADAFRAAVRTMNRRGCWPWEHMDEDVAITANVAFSTVTSAIKKPLSMHFTTASGGTADQKIEYETYDVFMERGNHNVAGQPYAYTIPNLFETGQIRWFPIPSANDTARFAFYRVTPAPRAEQEVIEAPDHVIETYMAFAWYEFVKRCPMAKSIISIEGAQRDARQAFKELSAHVAAPGDRSRAGIYAQF